MAAETTEKVRNPNPDERRKETDRAAAAIIEDERKARLAKNLRLRSMRLVKTTKG